MRLSVRLAAIALVAGIAAPAAATTVQYTPGSGQRSTGIAFIGQIGQSFTAVDTLLQSFGFQFNRLNNVAALPVTLTLRAGEGLDGAILKTVTTSLPTDQTGRTPFWFDFDMADTALTVGQRYSAIVTTGASARFGLVYGPDINLNTGVALGPDGYAGGRLLSAVASNGGPNCAGTASICDANFRFTSTTPVAAVPEPAGWALMIGGFGLAGMALRRRRGAVAIA